MGRDILHNLSSKTVSEILKILGRCQGCNFHWWWGALFHCQFDLITGITWISLLTDKTKELIKLLICSSALLSVISALTVIPGAFQYKYRVPKYQGVLLQPVFQYANQRAFLAILTHNHRQMTGHSVFQIAYFCLSFFLFFSFRCMSISFANSSECFAFSLTCVRPQRDFR